MEPPYTHELPPGHGVGRYCIDHRLREGGMATIYVGHHVATQAWVAIKVLHPDYATNPEVIARFEREAQVMGRLSGYPHIAAVHDVGMLADGRGYLVMELVRGRDLHDLLLDLYTKREWIDVARACRLMRDVGLGVAAAHHHGIVHRDLKPANIMLEQGPGGHEIAKVLDFGISADLGAKGQQQNLTTAGTVIGTPEYMAPEQATGAKASPSFDLYSLGVVMFELLTAQHPDRAWRHEGLPDPCRWRNDIPEPLMALLRQSTKMVAADRLPTAMDWVEQLTAILEQYEASPSQGWTMRERTPPVAAPNVSTQIIQDGKHRPYAVGVHLATGAASAQRTVPAPGPVVKHGALPVPLAPHSPPFQGEPSARALEGPHPTTASAPSILRILLYTLGGLFMLVAGGAVAYLALG